MKIYKEKSLFLLSLIEERRKKRRNDYNTRAETNIGCTRGAFVIMAIMIMTISVSIMTISVTIMTTSGTIMTTMIMAITVSCCETFWVNCHHPIFVRRTSYVPFVIILTFTKIPM